MEQKYRAKNLINKKQSILCHDNQSPSMHSISPMSMLCIKESQSENKIKISTPQNFPTTEKGHRIKISLIVLSITQQAK